MPHLLVWFLGLLSDLLSLFACVCVCARTFPSANYRCIQIVAFPGGEPSVSTSEKMQIMSSWLKSAVKTFLILPLFAHREQSVIFVWCSKGRVSEACVVAGVEIVLFKLLRNSYPPAKMFLLRQKHLLGNEVNLITDAALHFPLCYDAESNILVFVAREEPEYEFLCCLCAKMKLRLISLAQKTENGWNKERGEHPVHLQLVCSCRNICIYYSTAH